MYHSRLKKVTLKSNSLHHMKIYFTIMQRDGEDINNHKNTNIEGVC